MLSYKSITKCGNREINEDSVICVEQNGNYCFVVADGLGGHGKGEIASQKLVEVFLKVFETGHTETETFLKMAFDTAQNEIMKAQKAEGTLFDMKTTAVALIVIDGKCQWGHVGDSRLYMFYKNKVKMRTLDHSVPQMLVMSREIKERDIANHPDRNRLLRVMGIEWDLPKYTLSEEYDIDKCQAFLLCSDGFWEFIEENKMRNFLKKSSSVNQWLEMMFDEVEKNGNERKRDMDNYTAVAIWRK